MKRFSNLFFVSSYDKKTIISSSRKILEDNYNGILARSHEDIEPTALHLELMQLFFPEFHKESKDIHNVFLFLVSDVI